MAWSAIRVYDSLYWRGQYAAGLRALNQPSTWTEGSRTARLEALINHVVATVPYYNHLRAESAPGLHAFPVLDKRVISVDPSAFTSMKYGPQELIELKTSGSTGTPFRISVDKKKLANRTAQVVHFNRLAGYRVGQLHVLHAVGATKPRARRWLQSQVLSNPSVLSSEWLDAELARLQTYPIEFYVGYASALGAMATRAIERGIPSHRFRLRGIVATAERLPDQVRSTVRAAFGCPVVSRYSSIETGVLSQECTANGIHHLNDADFVIEVLEPDSDSPAAPGTVGRVVITDLHNWTMPLIRYDIGDLAVVAPRTCPCGQPGRSLTRLEGRIVENVRDAHGRLISWVAINDAMWRFREVSSFQFIQSAARRYEMRVEAKRASIDTALIRAALLNIVGAEADLHVVCVDEIPLLPSGKRQYIVNMFAGDLTPGRRSM